MSWLSLTSERSIAQSMRRLRTRTLGDGRLSVGRRLRLGRTSASSIGLVQRPLARVINDDLLPMPAAIYRFAYNGSGRAYVGVMAQEVQALVPEAVVRGRDGYLRVYYDKVGVKFQTYDQWIASGARVQAVITH